MSRDFSNRKEGLTSKLCKRLLNYFRVVTKLTSRHRPLLWRGPANYALTSKALLILVSFLEMLSLLLILSWPECWFWLVSSLFSFAVCWFLFCSSVSCSLSFVSPQGEWDLSTVASSLSMLWDWRNLSLPADVLWGSLTPKDVCGEARRTSV